MQRILFFVLLTIASCLAVAATRSDFESLSDAAAEKYTVSNHVGSRYAEEFSDWSTKPMLHAMDVCESHPSSSRYCDIIAVVAADGHIRRLVFSPSNPYVECVRKDLRLGAVAPKPPGDSWSVQIRLIDGPRPNYKGGDKPFIILSSGHEEQAKGPPDKPVGITSQEKVAAYDRAIAPYVAKARATYPDAKKRFLAGLPSGYRFSVRAPLTDPDGKREDSFIAVEKISDGKITGTIESRLTLVSHHRTGQHITVPETKIDNWVIVRPDGTEEGNSVGKFLDNYKPQ